MMMYLEMFSNKNIVLPQKLSFLSNYFPNINFGTHSPVTQSSAITFLVIGLLILSCFLLNNTIFRRENFKTDHKHLALAVACTFAILFINDPSEFIYFQF